MRADQIESRGGRRKRRAPKSPPTSASVADVVESMPALPASLSKEEITELVASAVNQVADKILNAQSKQPSKRVKKITHQVKRKKYANTNIPLMAELVSTITYEGDG